MSQIKNIMAIFIVSVSLLGAYFIIKNADLSGGGQMAATQEDDSSIFDKGGSWMDFITGKSEDVGDDGVSAGSLTDTEAIDREGINLTEALSQSFASQMFISSNGDVEAMQKMDLNNSEIKKILQSSLSDMPQTVFDVAVADSDIKISPDNSKEAKYNYMQAIGRVIYERFSSSDYARDERQIIADINSDCFIGGTSMNPELAKLYNNMADDYLAINVPSDWKDMHKRSVAFFKKSNLIYDALSGCKNDIVKGYAAAQTVPDLMSEEKSIQDMMIQKSKELSSAYFNHV